MSKSPPQSHLRFPLNNLFGKPGNVRVLRELFAPEAPLSPTEIARRAELTLRATRVVLDDLSVAGVVAFSGTGRAPAFAVSSHWPFGGVLADLFAAEADRWNCLFRDLRKLLDDYDVQSAWLYGSVSRGQDGPGSDVDVAIVLGKEIHRSEELRNALLSLEDRFQVVISPILLSAEDLAEAKGGGWLATSLADARLLIGSLPAAS